MRLLVLANFDAPVLLIPGVELEMFSARHERESGANQKAAFRYALENKFDGVAVVDTRTALPELSSLVHALQQNTSLDAVLGIVPWGPFSSFGSCVLNLLAGTSTRGWYAPARVFRPALFTQIAYELNAADTVFNTELLLQMIHHNRPYAQLPIQARFCPGRFVERSKAALKFRLQKVNLFYDVRYHPDVLSGSANDHQPEAYTEKFSSYSPHAIVAHDETVVPRGANILDVGCASGYLGRWLVQNKGARVTGVDVMERSQVAKELEAYHRLDLENDDDLFVAVVRDGNFDALLLLDVVEHLSSPERFLWSLSKLGPAAPKRFVLSTGNVAFIVVRLMLLLGHFNYGRKGILDITHKRLFSYHTFKNLLIQTGFAVVAERYCPLPFRELGLPGWLAGFLETINRFLIVLRPRLFAYQVLFVAKPL